MQIQQVIAAVNVLVSEIPSLNGTNRRVPNTARTDSPVAIGSTWNA